MAMKAGSRRHLLQIQYKTEIQNNYGEPVVTWTDDRKVWGAVMPLKGNEYFANRQTQSEMTCRVNIRYTTLRSGSAINSNCRFLVDSSTSRILNIISPINPQERNIELQFMCIEEEV